MYYLIQDESRDALVVDLGDASNVSAIEKREDIQVKGAIITHHHWDHSGKASDFAKQYPNAKIYGQDKDRIPALTDIVSDNQTIDWGPLKIQCISTPG